MAHLINYDYPLNEILRDIKLWNDKIEKQKWDDADTILDESLEKCKSILSSSDDGEEKNYALLSGILVRGMQNLTCLCKLLMDDNWIHDTSKIEKAWRYLCDAQDRLFFIDKCIDLSNYTQLLGRLNSIHDYFIDLWGEGLYMSPELIVCKELCSICRENIKSCDHVPNYLYNGKRCFSIPIDAKLRSISLVSNPIDRRCRIWPWNYDNENNTLGSILVMTSFILDDFITIEESSMDLLSD